MDVRIYPRSSLKRFFECTPTLLVESMSAHRSVALQGRADHARQAEPGEPYNDLNRIELVNILFPETETLSIAVKVLTPRPSFSKP